MIFRRVPRALKIDYAARHLPDGQRGRTSRVTHLFRQTKCGNRYDPGTHRACLHDPVVDAAVREGTRVLTRAAAQRFIAPGWERQVRGLC